MSCGISRSVGCVSFGALRGVRRDVYIVPFRAGCAIWGAFRILRGEGVCPGFVFFYFGIALLFGFAACQYVDFDFWLCS